MILPIVVSCLLMVSYGSLWFLMVSYGLLCPPLSGPRMAWARFKYGGEGFWPRRCLRQGLVFVQDLIPQRLELHFVGCLCHRVVLRVRGARDLGVELGILGAFGTIHDLYFDVVVVLDGANGCRRRLARSHPFPTSRARRLAGSLQLNKVRVLGARMRTFQFVHIVDHCMQIGAFEHRPSC